VIFLEGTKSNGQGVLAISEKLSSQLSGKVIHAIRFDFLFRFFSPFNTTDACGCKFLIRSLAELTHYMVAYYTPDLDDVIEKTPKNIVQIISKALTTKKTQYYVKHSLDANDCSKSY